MNSNADKVVNPNADKAVNAQTDNAMNIGIVGAGLMGRLLTWMLCQEGHTVHLFEEDKISLDMENGAAAAFTAAGMCAPVSECDVIDEGMLQSGFRALQRWPEIIAKLGVHVDYRQQGSIILAHQSEQQELHFFEQKISTFAAAREKIALVDQVRLSELEPELSSFQQGLHLQDEAWVNPLLLLSALLEQSLNKGAKLTDNCRPDEIQPHAIIWGNQRYGFDWVIDCRGLGAKEDWPNLRGVRGEVVWLHAPEVNLQHLVRLIHPRYHVYIVPRDNHRYVIGATEIESDDRRPITVRSIMELLSSAYSVHSGFAEATIIDTRVNCRPALIDNHPKISHEKGLIRVNGLFRHGFMLAPAKADEVFSYLYADNSTNSEERHADTV